MDGTDASVPVAIGCAAFFTGISSAYFAILTFSQSSEPISPTFAASLLYSEICSAVSFAPSSNASAIRFIWPRVIRFDVPLIVAGTTSPATLNKAFCAILPAASFAIWAAPSPSSNPVTTSFGIVSRAKSSALSPKKPATRSAVSTRPRVEPTTGTLEAALLIAPPAAFKPFPIPGNPSMISFPPLYKPMFVPIYPPRYATGFCVCALEDALLVPSIVLWSVS